MAEARPARGWRSRKAKRTSTEAAGEGSGGIEGGDLADEGREGGGEEAGGVVIGGDDAVRVEVGFVEEGGDEVHDSAGPW